MPPSAMFGASAIGVVSTTINPAYTAGEIARQLEFSEVRFTMGQSVLPRNRVHLSNELILPSTLWFKTVILN